MRRVKALRTQADTDCNQTAISYAKSHNFITVSQWSRYKEIFYKVEQKLSEDNPDARGGKRHTAAALLIQEKMGYMQCNLTSLG